MQVQAVKVVHAMLLMATTKQVHLVSQQHSGVGSSRQWWWKRTLWEAENRLKCSEHTHTDTHSHTHTLTPDTHEYSYWAERINAIS